MNNSAMKTEHSMAEVCRINDLVPDSGVCVKVDGGQVALFMISAKTGRSVESTGKAENAENGQYRIYAIANRDPVGGANVLSRGVIGDIGGEPVVASPLYKQHFSLIDGRCLEDGQHAVAVYPVHLDGDRVMLQCRG